MASGSSSSAQLCRFTNGSILSSPRSPDATGSVGEMLALRLRGGFHQQRQSLRICSCISVTPSVVRRRPGPAPSSPAPTAHARGKVRCHVVIRTGLPPQRRTPKRTEKMRVFSHIAIRMIAPVTIWVKNGEICMRMRPLPMAAIVSAAEQRAQHGAAPAHQRGAAEHHRRDDVEFEADGRVRGAGAETRRDQMPAIAEAMPGEDIDGGHDPAAPACRRGAPPRHWRRSPRPAGRISCACSTTSRGSRRPSR